MTAQPAALLRLSRALVGFLRLFNLAMVAVAVAMFAASFAFEPAFREFFTRKPDGVASGLLMPLLRLWMVLALPVLAAAHVLYTRLLEMIDAVRAGEPFAAQNAARLTTIGWCLLVGQIFDLVCGVMAKAMTMAGSDIDWTFSPTGWLAVLLVFVLARVFEEGSRIRGELGEMI